MKLFVALNNTALLMSLLLNGPSDLTAEIKYFSESFPFLMINLLPPSRVQLTKTFVMSSPFPVFEKRPIIP